MPLKKPLDGLEALLDCGKARRAPCPPTCTDTNVVRIWPGFDFEQLRRDRGLIVDRVGPNVVAVCVFFVIRLDVAHDARHVCK